MLLIIQYTFNPSSVQTTRPQSPNNRNLILVVGMQSGMHELSLVTCPPDLVLVPYEHYKSPKKQYGLNKKSRMIFTVNGCYGVPLNLVQSGGLDQLDEQNSRPFEGCGTKVTYVVQFPGYAAFKPQKYAYVRRNGKQVPNNRAKVVRQVSEVMEAFMSSIAYNDKNPLSFGPDGIRLEDLYLLEIRQVAKASFQPIFAVKKDRVVYERYQTYSSSILSDNQHGDVYHSTGTVQDIRNLSDVGVVEGAADYRLYNAAEIGRWTDSSDCRSSPFYYKLDM